MDINLADGVALGIILIWTCIGFSKGMAGQVATLVTGLLTVATAYFAYTPCRHLLAAHVQGSETFIRIAAGVVVIVVPFTLIMLARCAKVMGLSLSDNCQPQSATLSSTPLSLPSAMAKNNIVLNAGLEAEYQLNLLEGLPQLATR